MIRRKFLGLFVATGVIFVVSLFGKNWVFRKIFYRIEGLFKKPKMLPVNIQRTAFEIPRDVYSISVETALNSRCNSDYDGDPKKFHWGMLEESKRISDEQIRQIINLATVPHFTDERVGIQIENNMLSFVMDGQKQGLMREHMMIESGMQQQAMALVCAALGIGMVFNNSGKDGRKISETDYENIRIKLDAMKPSYNDSYWTSRPPKGSGRWRHDNLPEPVRNGEKPLLSVLRELKVENLNGKVATQESISQLLWAARGRTPHLYKSRPWGMTIPTWGGEQNITSVYLIVEGKLSRYVNWRWNGWAHSTELLTELGEKLGKQLLNWLAPYNCLIVLAKNENFGRAYWEIGYQILNLMLQAKSLNLSYRAVLLDEKQKEYFNKMGIRYAVATLFTTFG